VKEIHVGDKFNLEREQKARDFEEYIRKPRPGYGEDRASYYVIRQGNACWMGSIKEGEPLPAGAELVRGPNTTVEMVSDFLHPRTKLIANEDILERLAYAIDRQRLPYALGKGAREGRTRRTEAKRRSDRIAEYTKALQGPNADRARRWLRKRWFEEFEGGISEDAINRLIDSPEEAIERILLLRRPKFTPWHDCATSLATTYALLFARTEKLTKELACSKTGTLIYFLRNALEEITGQHYEPAAIAKVLKEDIKRSLEKKFRDIR